MIVLLSLYVVFGVGTSVVSHYLQHRLINSFQFGIAFFLILNIIICWTEMCLGASIQYIKTQAKKVIQEYKGKESLIAGRFFFLPVTWSNVFTTNLWAEMWITYTVFDPSYANDESFGFFIDVGNGYTTIIPSIVYLIGMTFPILSPRILGIIGLVSFYQEFYGTVIYWLSFIWNKRYSKFSFLQVLIFIGLTNGIWFIFPIIGMHTSYRLILDNSFAVFLS